ncbi:putative sulfate exporter family transporter [Dehalobacter sp. DCM]|uniref:YeiH family protein n=1 Tax=Dehalobacter sp. DCM TaxID=2907827 RepID=UPI003081AB75|nr:putative sulfate exporter family transporter [Dehalobacter sp. DCM]
MNIQIKNNTVSCSFGNNANYILGILFTLMISMLGTFLANLPVIGKIGPMIISIIIAVVYRNVIGYPELIRKGITFTSQHILRFAIILYGFKLNMDVIIHQGAGLLLRGSLTIVIAIMVTMIISYLLHGEKQLSLLLGIGTGICGAAAIAAAAPILDADQKDTAISVGIIALIGTIFTILYSIIMPYLPLSLEQYAIWSGLSLHEIAHVAAAASPAGNSALAVGLLAKLCRVFLLIPFCFGLSLFIRIKGNKNKTKVPMPWFLLGFIATSLIGTYLPIPQNVLQNVSVIATYLLAAAMVGLGLNVQFSSLNTRIFKSLLSMTIASILVSGISFLITYIC